MSVFRTQHMAVAWHEMTDEESPLPAAHASLKEKAALIGRVGLMMLSSGTAAWRVRASINKLSRGLGVVTNADIGLLTLNYTCFEDGEQATYCISLNTTGVNTTKIYAMKEFTDRFSEKAEEYSAGQFHNILDKIESLPENYKPWQTGLAAAAACAAFAFLLGGGPVEMFCAFFGAGLGNYLRKILLQRRMTLFVNVSLSVACACMVYVLLIKAAELLLHIPEVHQAGYICSMLFVIPGFPLITGGMDLAKLDLRSGTERITYALLIISLAALTGWVTAAVSGFAPSEFAEMQLAFPLMTLLRMAASFAGVYFFSMMLGSLPKMAAYAGVIGMTANTLRLCLTDLTPMPAAAAAFIGAMCAGLMASAIRKKAGFPRITLTVPSIVIMVPGMFMYKGFYYLAAGSVTDGAMWLVRAGLIVFALPLGLIAARILTDNNFRVRS